MEKFGIKNIKVVLVWALGTFQEVSEALEDKKIKLFEALGFTDNVIGIEKLVKAGPQLQNEIGDLSSDELHEIEEFINENYEFENMTAKEIMAAAFKIISGASQLIGAIKNK